VPRAAEPRKALAHYGAPALFLLAVTVAVLLIRAGLESGSSGQPTTTATPATTRAASHRTKPHRKHVAPAAQYYTVQSGDTFGSISAKTGATIAQLEQLNPGVSPNALQVGQKLRVK